MATLPHCLHSVAVGSASAERGWPRAVLPTGVLSQAEGQERLLQEIQTTKLVPQKQKTRVCSGNRGEIWCDGALGKTKL